MPLYTFDVPFKLKGRGSVAVQASSPEEAAEKVDDMTFEELLANTTKEEDVEVIGDEILDRFNEYRRPPR